MATETSEAEETTDRGAGVGLQPAQVIVLGAGISGLVTASVLLGQGVRDILVVDSYKTVGGNHLDRTVGPYTFDVGSLIFQDDSPLLAHFPDLLPEYVQIDPTWSRLNPQGRVTEYPFSVRDDLLAAGPAELARITASAIRARLGRRAPRTAKDFAEHWLGPRFVARSGLAHYMERFCGVPTDQIDVEFAQSRMMWIADHARVRSLARRAAGSLRRTSRPPRKNRQLARPREGFAALYAPAVASLEARGVRFVLGAELQELVRESDGGFTLATSAGALRAPRVLSTIPVDHALALCGLPGGDLPTVTLVTLFFSFAGQRAFDASVLYNFSGGGMWKRLTVYSDFYGRSPGPDRREYLGVEVVSTRATQSINDAVAGFREHTSANGLFSGDLRLEGSSVLTHAYPIYTRGSGDRARAGVASLAAFGVQSLGRQGGFEYQPTARHSTLEAEASLGRRPPPVTPKTERSAR